VPDAVPAAANPFNPAYAVLCLVFALLVLKLFGRRNAGRARSARVSAIDGLRGYLAFFVFLHHSAFWYSFVKTNSWTMPDSHLFAHFGQSSVLLFFMITGFLFFSKIRANQRTPVDWLRLFVSRVLRLTPLYLVVVAIVCVIVGFETHFSLREAPSQLARHVLHWAAFCAFDSPALNRFGSTWLISAGVAWTLRIEWLFYLALPLIGAAVAPRRYVILSAVVVSLFVLNSPFAKTIVLFAFGSGMFAALCAEQPQLRALARSPFGAAFVLAPLVFAVVHFRVAYQQATEFPTSEEFYVLGLATLAFVAISAGNTLFGALSHPLSRRLGDVSYGIYLFQGIVLYVTFRFVIGYQRAAALPTPLFWCVIAACGGVLILISLLCFRFIETPALRLVDGVTHGLRSLGKAAPGDPAQSEGQFVSAAEDGWAGVVATARDAPARDV
jgi:peptidoglycan/LPS O-acetylase OafA/YrhL